MISRLGNKWRPCHREIPRYLVGSSNGKEAILSSSELWTSLERHREFITNGLDLLSFVLVTPELLRFTQLALGKLTYWVGFFLITFGFVIAIFIVTEFMELIPQLIVWILCAVLVLGLIFQNELRDWWGTKGLTASRWVSRHAFFLGVAFFSPLVFLRL